MQLLVQLFGAGITPVCPAGVTHLLAVHRC
jgi:hypothetical protein